MNKTPAKLKYFYLVLAFLGLVVASLLGRSKALELKMDIKPLEQPPVQYVELTPEEMKIYQEGQGVNAIVRCNNINCPEKFK